MDNKIHCQEFHELAMDYRGASMATANRAYEALCSYVQKLIATPSAASAAPAEKYGCHIDLADDEVPDNCVLDGGHIDHCFYAMKHGKEARNFCGEWRPVKLVAASSPKYELTDEKIATMWMTSQDQAISGKPAPLHFAHAVLAASGPNAGLTDAQISAVARYLSDFSSAQCGVDKDDAWKIYGSDEVAVLRDALAAAGVDIQP